MSSSVAWDGRPSGGCLSQTSWHHEPPVHLQRHQVNHHSRPSWHSFQGDWVRRGVGLPAVVGLWDGASEPAGAETQGNCADVHLSAVGLQFCLCQWICPLVPDQVAGSRVLQVSLIQFERNKGTVQETGQLCRFWQGLLQGGNSWRHFRRKLWGVWRKVKRKRWTFNNTFFTRNSGFLEGLQKDV